MKMLFDQRKGVVLIRGRVDLEEVTKVEQKIVMLC